MTDRIQGGAMKWSCMAHRFVAIFLLSFLFLVSLPVMKGNCFSACNGTVILLPSPGNVVFKLTSLDSPDPTPEIVKLQWYEVANAINLVPTACWRAAAMEPWITVSTPIYDYTNKTSYVQIGIDTSVLKDYATVSGDNSTVFSGNVTVITGYTILNSSNTSPSGSHMYNIPVRVYVEESSSAECSIEKKGEAFLSPSRVDFYMPKDSLDAPDPVNVEIKGLLTSEIHTGGTTFCWTARAQESWISLNEKGGIVHETGGDGGFSVGIDPDRIRDYLADNQQISAINGTILITTNLSDSKDIALPVKVTLTSPVDVCAKTLDGKMVVSPENVKFYFSDYAQGTYYETINISLSPGQGKENANQFCWLAAKSDPWILLEYDDGGYHVGEGNIRVGIDPGRLPEGFPPVTGTVTIRSNLRDDSIKTIFISVLNGSGYEGETVLTYGNDICSQADGELTAAPSELNFYVFEEETAQFQEAEVGLAYKIRSQNATVCWTIAGDADWLRLERTEYENKFKVIVDTSRLPVLDFSEPEGQPARYDANITITSNLSNPADGINIPVHVYVSSLRETDEETMTTAQSLDIELNIPYTDGLRGTLYILAEHPRLLPDRIYAYDGMTFHLVSEQGILMSDALWRYYTDNIQLSPVSSVFVLGPSDTSGVSRDGGRKMYLRVPVHTGYSLHGCEGDFIFRAVLGSLQDAGNPDKWHELLYKKVHVVPISGRWLVTDYIDGETYSYADEYGIYPMVIYEENGRFTGSWDRFGSSTPLTVRYVDSPMPGYEISFKEDSPDYGLVEYLYRVESFDGRGYMEGTWQYKLPGENHWSVPQRFTAVRQDVVIPLVNNEYLVDGKANGVPMQFIIDTGATGVLIDAGYASSMGIDLNDNNRCQQTEATGVGGVISTITCKDIAIEIDGRLRATVDAVFSDSLQGPALLGMEFLKNFHVTVLDDGNMVIAP